MSRAFYVDLKKMESQSRKIRVLLKRRSIKYKSKIKEALEHSAMYAAASLTQNTFPKGYGFVLVKKQMIFDICQIFISGSKVYASIEESSGKQLAGAFYAAYKQRNYSEANRVLQRTSSQYSSLEFSPLSITKDLDHRYHKKQIVSKEDMEQYLPIAIRRIGKTASGWASCVEQLGGDGDFIKWKGTTIHGGDGGEVIFIEDADGMRVWMSNLRELAYNHTNPDAVKTAMEVARWDLETTLSYMGFKNKN